MNLEFHREGGVAFLNKLLRRGLIEKVKFEQWIEGGKGISYMALRRKGITGRGKCLCRDPEVGACLAHSGDRKEANMAEWSELEVGDEVQR